MFPASHDELVGVGEGTLLDADCVVARPMLVADTRGLMIFTSAGASDIVAKGPRGRGASLPTGTWRLVAAVAETGGHVLLGAPAPPMLS